VTGEEAVRGVRHAAADPRVPDDAPIAPDEPPAREPLRLGQHLQERLRNGIVQG
jgi:hypothetical protein